MTILSLQRHTNPPVATIIGRLPASFSPTPLPLSPQEQALAQRSWHPERLATWHGARQALAQLCQELGLAYWGVQKTPHGQPQLAPPTPRSYHISLSHSYPFVAAAVAEVPVGIDIQVPAPRLERVAHRFLTADEQATGPYSLAQLCSYWAAKEAVVKCSSPDTRLLKDIVLHLPAGAEVIHATTQATGQHYAVRHRHTSDFTFAWCTRPSDN